MSANAVALLNLATQALTQAMQYQITVSKAVAEGRDVSDAELADARNQTRALLDFLAVQQPGQGLPPTFTTAGAPA
jgi:hypothetical protein